MGKYPSFTNTGRGERCVFFKGKSQRGLTSVVSAAVASAVVSILMVSAAVSVTMAVAGMALAVLMVVVVTSHVGIVGKRTVEESCNCRVCIAGNTAEQADACVCEGYLCAAADTAADKCVNALDGEEACQCTVAAAVGVHNLRVYNLSVSYFINLKLSRMSEVLKNLSVFVSYCDFHINSSDLYSFVRYLNISLFSCGVRVCRILRIMETLNLIVTAMP